MTKTRPAPLGATYKRNARLGWLNRSDAAPKGANRVLFGRGYKDFAPPELGCSIANHPDSCGRLFCVPCDLLRLFQTSVNSVSLADVAKGRNGAKSALW
jgi:hypothetical protein